MAVGQKTERLSCEDAEVKPACMLISTLERQMSHLQEGVQPTGKSS